MIICADDFGIFPENDEIILELANTKKISAVSVVIVAAKEQKATFEALKKVHDTIDIGLHFFAAKENSLGKRYLSLSEQKGIPSFNEILLKSLLGRNLEKYISEEMKAQLELFTETFNFLPDFIDSHLHIHQLPHINKIFLQNLKDSLPSKKFYVRHTATKFSHITSSANSFLKRISISERGAQFRKMLIQSGIPHNNLFFGVYNYKCWRNFSIYLKEFLQEAQHVNDIIMVHPGISEEWRKEEYLALKGREDFSSNRFKWGTM